MRYAAIAFFAAVWVGIAPTSAQGGEEPALEDVRLIGLSVSAPRHDTPQPHEGLILTLCARLPEEAVGASKGELNVAVADTGQDLLIPRRRALESIHVEAARQTIRFRVRVDYPTRDIERIRKLEGEMLCRFAGPLERKKIGRFPLHEEDADDRDEPLHLHLKGDRLTVRMRGLKMSRGRFLGLRFVKPDGSTMVLDQSGQGWRNDIMTNVRYRRHDNDEAWPEAFDVELFARKDAGTRKATFSLADFPFPDGLLAAPPPREEKKPEAATFERLRARLIAYRERHPLDKFGNPQRDEPERWVCEVVLTGRLPRLDPHPERFERIVLTEAVADHGPPLVSGPMRIDRIGGGGRRSVRLFLPLPPPDPEAERLVRVSGYLKYDADTPHRTHTFGPVEVGRVLGNADEPWWELDLHERPDADCGVYLLPGEEPEVFIVLPRDRGPLAGIERPRLHEVTLHDADGGASWNASRRMSRHVESYHVWTLRGKTPPPDRVNVRVRYDSGRREGRIPFTVEDVELPPVPPAVAQALANRAPEPAADEEGKGDDGGEEGEDVFVEGDPIRDPRIESVEISRLSLRNPRYDTDNDTYQIACRFPIRDEVLDDRQGRIVQATADTGAVLYDPAVHGENRNWRVRMHKRGKDEAAAFLRLPPPPADVEGIKRIEARVRYLASGGKTDREFGLLKARDLEPDEDWSEMYKLYREEEKTPAFYFRKGREGKLLFRESGHAVKEIRLVNEAGDAYAPKKGPRKRRYSHNYVYAEFDDAEAAPDAVGLIVTVPEWRRLTEHRIVLEDLPLLGGLLPEEPFDRAPPPPPEPPRPEPARPDGPEPPDPTEDDPERPPEPQIF